VMSSLNISPFPTLVVVSSAIMTTFIGECNQLLTF
jgi:hypothetical protein